MLLALMLLGYLALAVPAQAQGTAVPAAAEPSPPPEQAKQLVTLLQDPALRSWLQGQLDPPVAGAAPQGIDAAAVAINDSDRVDSQMEDMWLAVLARWRAHRQLITAALPGLPAAIGTALERLGGEMAGWGLPACMLSVLLFVGCGLAAEWLFLRSSRRVRRKVLDASERTIGERLRKAALRLTLALTAVLIFAAASLGVFLVFEWPPLFREVAGRFLFAAILFRLGLILARFLLTPWLPKLRIVPMGTDDALFWYRRWAVLLGIFVFGWATATSLRTLGAPLPVRALVAYLFGLGLLATAIETTWRRQRNEGAENAAAGGEGDNSLGATPSVVPSILATLFFALIYLLWLQSAMRLFWALLIAGVLPAAIRVTQAGVDNLLRPVGAEADRHQAAPPSVAAAVVERGARTLLIVGAALFLAWAWELDLAALSRAETGTGRLFAALLSIVLILLLTDFLWHVARTAIDRHIAGACIDPHAPTTLDDAELRRRGRIRTLLPICRNILFVVLMVTAVLMALSAMGVQIAPLLAGAGVVGVAVGFGSQTLVKDVMSGMFYLLDDAFRVGEYIVAGSYKGTVESFSLRSIKLRHQRGPLYTVPFGSLGAIQNLSRDWVIDKIMLNVTYDTDLSRIKKVVKQVSAEIMADPELAPSIIEPLKSQGVYNMGDFAIQIRMKITCKPGQQFTVRRAIYEKVKRAFDANGIKFAFPTVTVAGNGGAAEATPAAAQHLVQTTGAATT